MERRLERTINFPCQLVKSIISGIFFARDSDDFSALKRLVAELVEKNALASQVSIHNFDSLDCASHFRMIYMMWPTPSKGYTGHHLLRIWEKVRGNCANRKNPLKLVGHSTDSAGFSRCLSHTYDTN